MLFGQNTSNNQGGGLFGNLGGQQPPQSGFGGAQLFGQQSTQSPQQQQGGASLFGGGGFGSNQQQNPQQAFQQPQQAQGLFGAQQPNPQQTQAAGIFGNAASQPGQGLFGKSTFGAQPQQTQQATGLFGNQQQQPQQQGGQGLFGAPQQNTGGNLFGQQQQPIGGQQQPIGGGLFGGNQPTGGMLFGATQQVQAGAFGAQQPQQQAGGGLFGAQGQTQQQSGGWLNQQNSQQPQQSVGGWGAFGQQQPTQQTPQQNTFGFLGAGGQQLQQNTFQCKMLDKNFCKREDTGQDQKKILLGVNCITLMPQFKDKSTIELRNEDYKSMKTGQIPDDLKQLIMANIQFQSGQISQLQLSQMFNMGNQNTGFSQQSQQSPFFQYGNLFGGGFQKQQSGGGLFQANQQQQGGMGLLNNLNQNQTQPAVGFFNQGNPNQQQQTGLFGGGFGQTQNAIPQATGLFGQQQQQLQQQPQQNTLFGANTTFGAQQQQQPGGSLFGSTQPQQQQSALGGGGLFQNAQQPQQQNAGFGFNTGFGQKPDQTQQSNLFGGQTGGTLFGQNQQQQQQQQQQKPGGLFGTGFGATTAASTTQNSAFSQAQPAQNNTLFGQPQQQQQSGGLFSNLQQSNQQPQQGGLFGQPTQSTSTTSFQQPQQQGLLNYSQPQQAQQQIGTGLLGQTSQLGTGLLNSQTQGSQPLFGLPQTQSSNYGFGQPQPQQQDQVNIVIQLPKIDWKEHYSDFFGSIGLDSYNQQQKDLMKFKNVKECLDFQQYQMKYNPFSESYSWGETLFKEPHHLSLSQESQLLKSSKIKSENQEDLLEIANLLKSQKNSEQQEIYITFKNHQIQLQIPENSQVRDVKKRALKEFNLTEDNYCYQLVSNNELLNDFENIDWKRMNNLEIAIMDKENYDVVKAQTSLKIDEFKCSRSEFETSPPLQELYRMSQQELSQVQNFKIFNEFGEITFQKSVDLTGIDLSECVNISQNCIEIYTKNQNQKPPIGKGLNVPAILNYYQVKRPSQIDSDKFIKRIKRTAGKNQVEFVSFNETAGILVIKADHF